jgi:hypothetical protein
MGRLTVIVLILLATVLVVMLSIRKESFTPAEGDVTIGKDEVLIEPTNPPYSTRHIMSIADYDDTGSDTPNPLPYDDPMRSAMELDVVARSTAEKKRAVKQARLDANHYNKAKLAADNQLRAEDEATWTGASPSATALAVEAFADIEGSAFNPADKDVIEAEERKLLMSYVPKKSDDLMTYSVDDAETLIKKIYDGRKQVPSYRVRDDGVYEVYEVVDKDPKIVWEDDIAGGARATAEGDYIRVPPVAQQAAASMDPFFEPLTRLRTDRSDYMAFTPQLERMFAPTNPRMDWY